MRTRTKHSIVAIGLTLLGTAAGGVASAGQVTLVDVPSDQPTPPANAAPAPLPVIPAGSGATRPDDAGDPVQVHVDRVESLVSFARALRASCAGGAGEDPKAALEKAAARLVAERKGIEAVEARQKKLEQDLVARPFEARTVAALGAVKREKKALEDAARREVAGKVDEAARGLVGLRGELCAELCGAGDTASSPVDMCEFSSPALANAAVIADHRSVEAVARHVARKFAPIRVVLADRSVLSLAEMGEADPLLARQWPLLGVPAAATRIFTVQHTGLEVAAFTAATLDVGVRALASFVGDRARREALAWFLERLHEDACGRAKTPAGAQGEPYREIRSYWLPTTCALSTRRLDFAQYGGGESLLGALRGAVASDVKGWPGVALGLGVGTSLWADMNLGGTLFSCEEDPSAPLVCETSTPDRVTCEARARRRLACGAEARLRAAAGKLVSDLSTGANAALSLAHFGDEIDGVNGYRVFRGAPGRLFSPRLEIAACAASLPHVFQEYGELVRQTRPGRAEETEALLLAALTTSPACFTLVGRGFSRSDCPVFSADLDAPAARACRRKDPNLPGDPDAALLTTLEATGPLEKLSTIVRWSSFVRLPAAELATRWSAVLMAFEAYRAAAEALRAPIDPRLVPPPALQIGVDVDGKKIGEIVRALEAYARDTSRLASQTRSFALQRAAVVLARASLDLAVAFVAAGERLSEAAPLPGLCKAATCSPGEIAPHFAAARVELGRLAGSVETIEAALAEDWGRVVARVVAAARADLTRMCQDEACRELCAAGKGPCRPLDAIARHSGLFASIAFEADPSRIAEALDAAAMPIGGWRRKNTPGATTLSINAFPGMFVGGELRFGTYGTTTERGGVPHVVAPTLTMPLGLDFASGRGGYNLGAFFSLIDPAAYLQYDVERNGRLPGAQLLTLLAPGVYLRAGLFDSPFNLGIYGVFRPGLRAWESGLSMPGAHALQVGLAASVDVTIFDLFTGKAAE
ncbi:hypothetical protein [Polyangium spumosum]|uniref:Uncharacterized protein n=1 Tax=Polyangium spumosum TaxID=889282 RepID=A0A6N7PK46_9BACT|nr:hypothetical protein [Polyangium spumosum]MRG91206.1 hypothetical protein [Polyangium spumosum]